ncbi:MAG: hypothetical protein J5965_20480 [Aeriscardovia sp.]|nr:hypothetical protein [Aeriscardovia sp.]
MATNYEELLTDEPKDNGTMSPFPTMSDEEKVRRDTYTDEEIRDVNNISVTIPDSQTPIVVFFGSQASGKTLTLLRLIRFLESEGHGYTVEPEYVFRPQSDKHYKKMCDELKNMAYSEYAPGGTDVISFMLVKVLDHGSHPICQILEAPGEHYFDGTANLDFPTYIHTIRQISNPKIWVFFVEQDWGKDANERSMYAQKICKMQELVMPNDKIIFLFNKCDKKPNQYLPNRHPNVNAFFTNIQNQYPNIFSKYTRTGIESFFFGKYNFQQVCFSSGTFTRTANNREKWIPGKDFYCEDLWKLIS